MLSNQLVFYLFRVTQVYFFGSILISLRENFSLSLVFPALLLPGVLAVSFKTAHKDQPAVDKNTLWKNAGLTVLASVIGAWLTFGVSHNLGVGPVAASALVGLAGSLLAPKFSLEIFTGSFVGMCSSTVAPQISRLLLAAVLAGSLFFISRSELAGFGGKLGTIAFISVILTSLVLGGELPSAAPQTGIFSWLVVALAAFAAVLTWQLADIKALGVVRASSVVGLAGGILLPLLLPDVGSSYAIVVFCASFVGMSSRERMPAGWMVMLAGAISGTLFQLTAGLFGGIGGRLGTIALGSVLTLSGYKAIFSRLRMAKPISSSMDQE